MTSTGVLFDGKHSFIDYGLTLASRSIGTPSKIKVKERVPFSNTVYDFSGIYGEQEYEERLLTYVFNVKDYRKVNLENKKTEVINWLMTPNQKIKLFDDYIPSYYFLSEVEGKIDFEEMRYNGKLTVNFTAYPFRVSELEEGNDIWDTFNFLLDYAQITQFNISGSLNVTLYNPGVKVAYPIINTSNPMQITKNGVIYSVPSGESQSFDFALLSEKNDLKISGNGSISFHFRKELI